MLLSSRVRCDEEAVEAGKSEFQLIACWRQIRLEVHVTPGRDGDAAYPGSTSLSNLCTCSQDLIRRLHWLSSAMARLGRDIRKGDVTLGTFTKAILLLIIVTVDLYAVSVL